MTLEELQREVEALTDEALDQRTQQQQHVKVIVRHSLTRYASGGRDETYFAFLTAPGQSGCVAVGITPEHALENFRSRALGEMCEQLGVPFRVTGFDPIALGM